ncbi:MAG: hypothetical protein AAGG02_06235 [Cyanobacteria bacterium P01_H01_bin.15]
MVHMRGAEQLPHDIFISYAHVDDEGLLEGENGWVADFEKALKYGLRRIRGKEPLIWRDYKLQGNHDFSNEIEQKLKQARLFI